jgi:alkylhydroperoxidase family enzyme
MAAAARVMQRGGAAMARIELVAEAALDAGLCRYRGRTADGVLLGLAHAPELAERWLAFYVPLTKEDGRLPIELKELVRLQIAGVYGCDYCTSFITPPSQARGLTVDKVRWVMMPDAPAAPFTPAERAMLRYTLTMATGSGQLSDADVAAVRAHFRDDQVVELSMLAAALIGFGRVSITGLKLVE